MRTFNKVVPGLMAAAVSWGFPAQADNHANPQVVPVELYTCDFQDGKNMGDLNKVSEKVKAWVDKNDSSYSAWTLTPQFRALEDGFDVGWIGSWDSGVSMGKSLDNFMSSGGEISEDINDVVDCSNSHVLMSSVAINAPKGPPNNGVVMFSSCEVDDDSNLQDAFQAHMKMGAKMRERGSKVSSWLMYPSLGFGETDFDYYLVVAADSYSDLGAGWDAFHNKGGWEERDKMFQGIVECDSPRAYNARLVRRAPDPSS